MQESTLNLRQILYGVQLIKKKIDVMRSVGRSFDIIKVQLALTH